MRYFLRGYFGGGDLGDMTKLLEEVLRVSGVQGAALTRLVADVIDVGFKWGLDMSRYRPRGGHQRTEQPSCPGHVMQIFVHTSVVDAIAYGSLPLGAMASAGAPITGWLGRQCPLDGQARLLVHPDLFLDTTSGLVRVFTHCGSP